MSRALDEDVKRALKNGNHQKVYDEIAHALVPSDGLLEIELLGPSHPVEGDSAILQDGNAIGIPKLRLVQAFLVARKFLLAQIQGLYDGPVDEILRATGVVLLMDPEHLTAANTRKRLITGLLGAESNTKLVQEKQLTDSLLTSRLHRHTKSPTLWSHRRWLMEQFKAQGLQVAVEEDIANIVMTAGIRHPRNYYAWCHARDLVETFVVNPAQLSSLIAATEKWCFSHQSDVSGWQFLVHLLERKPDETAAVFLDTIKRVTSFSWRTESVWYFLRQIAAGATGPVGLETADTFEETRRMLWESAEDSGEKRILETARDWQLKQSAG